MGGGGAGGARAGDDTRSVAVPGFHGAFHARPASRASPTRSRIAGSCRGPQAAGWLWQPRGLCPCASAPRAAHAFPALYPGALGDTSLRRIGVLLIERAGNPLCRQWGGAHKCLETERSDLSGSIFYNSAWQQWGGQAGRRKGDWRGASEEMGSVIQVSKKEGEPGQGSGERRDWVRGRGTGT